MKHIFAIVFLAIAAIAMAQVAQKPAIQPIPTDELKAVYVDFLELQLSQERLTAAQKELDAKKDVLNKRYQGLLDAAKVNTQGWNIDLKSGVMTKKEAPKAEAPKK